MAVQWYCKEHIVKQSSVLSQIHKHKKEKGREKVKANKAEYFGLPYNSSMSSHVSRSMEAQTSGFESDPLPGVQLHVPPRPIDNEDERKLSLFLNSLWLLCFVSDTSTLCFGKR